MGVHVFPILNILPLKILKMEGFFFFLVLVFKTILFCIGYNRLTNSVVIVSGGQQRDSVIHVYAKLEF